MSVDMSAAAVTARLKRGQVFQVQGFTQVRFDVEDHPVDAFAIVARGRKVAGITG